MSKPRTHCWYRAEAERLRKRAAAAENDAPLRDSYLSLAREYERLADVLEARRMLIDAELMYARAVTEQYQKMSELVLCCGLGDLEAAALFTSENETPSKP